MKKHRLVVLAILGALWQCADLVDSTSDSEQRPVLNGQQPVITQAGESDQGIGLPLVSKDG